MTSEFHAAASVSGSFLLFMPAHCHTVMTTEALKENQAMISVIRQTCAFLTLNKSSEKGQLTH